MKMIRVAVALGLALIGSAGMASTCTSKHDLGNMGPPDFAWLGNSFSSSGNYIDCYTFDLTGAADSFGGALEINLPGDKLSLDLRSVSLYAGGLDGKLIGIDTTPLAFGFGALAGGVSYTLAVANSVTYDKGLYALAPGYIGAFATYAAPVPEPTTAAMLMVGLFGVGIAARRKTK
jgi:PEP-CTERM motif